MKDALRSRLRRTEPVLGAMHLPRRLHAKYLRQRSAERVVTRFRHGRPIRTRQPKRHGVRNKALDTFVYAHPALDGLISMGMPLHEEADAAMAAGRNAEAPVTISASAPIIRSARTRFKSIETIS